MRTITVVTVARSDYGIYLPLLSSIQAEPELKLRLIVAGSHLVPELGLTRAAIEADGFTIDEQIEMVLASDSPAGTVTSMGLGLIGFAQCYARVRPDLLLVLGDRFDMYVAALAALPFRIPVAHIHGGEITSGAIDDALRHSITKLSHLHFVATDAYRRRVIQLGEEPWRVTISGSPGLDHLRTFTPLRGDVLEERLRLCLDQPALLVTYHPVTLELGETAWQIGELLQALEQVDLPVIFTAPNADPGGRLVAQMIEQFCASRPRARMVTNLGTAGYFSLMARAAAMVGNSSSGIIEAPSFRLPVVNIGSRQQGRVRAANVIDVGYSCPAIREGLTRALSPAFRDALEGLVNPYGDGTAAARIVQRLKTVPLDQQLIMKHFYDLPGADLLSDTEGQR